MRHHEFWPPAFFEIPYYVRLALGALRRGLSPFDLLKANHGIDHGGFAFASKEKIQKSIGEGHFPKSLLVSATLSLKKKKERILIFSEQNGWPLILKPDSGFTGRGVRKVTSEENLSRILPHLFMDYLVQAYIEEPEEYGVFYVRHHGKAGILGINGKTFPEITGDGVRTIVELSKTSARYSPHWRAFLADHDLGRVPGAGERVRLSFIGSHTMGCLFTDASHLLAPGLERKVFEIFENFPGFNFGRLDVKCRGQSALSRGDFKLIEVNGIDSLPTHLFDPSWTTRQSYRELFRVGGHLLEAAMEHRKQEMPVLPHRQVVSRTLRVVREVKAQHERLLLLCRG